MPTRIEHLPWFEVEGAHLLKRATIIVRRGRIAQCFHSVFPPDKDAQTVIARIRDRAA